MPNEKTREASLIIKSVTFSGTLNIKWLHRNDSLGDYEEASRKFKEAPRADFREAADDIFQQALQIAGFPSEDYANWSLYKPKKITLDGINVAVEGSFYANEVGTVGIALPETAEIPAQVVQAFIDEVKGFIKGDRRKQGSLFSEMQAEAAEADIVGEDGGEEAEYEGDPQLEGQTVPQLSD